MAAKRTIPVTILGQEYRIRSDGDVDGVRSAAAVVDDTMAKVQKQTGTVDTRDVAVLAALNIANRLVTSQVETAATSSELRPLIELVEAELSPPTR